jgi:7-cyano-7-deazaguanine synthase
MHGDDSIAVLISGGLDSSILLGEMLRTHSRVHPLFVRSGLFWESVELDHLKRYLEAIRYPALQPLQILEAPITDICPDHWSVRGRDVPDENSPDEAVYIPGRNVLLLSKAMLWCHLNRVPAVAMGTLSSNPFPDATPAFFDSFERIVNSAIGGSVRILRPYAHLHKSDVMACGRGLPLQFTFACLRPVNGLHCGHCNKCQERRVAFRDVGMADPTRYESEVV